MRGVWSVRVPGARRSQNPHCPAAPLSWWFASRGLGRPVSAARLDDLVRSLQRWAKEPTSDKRRMTENRDRRMDSMRRPTRYSQSFARRPMQTERMSNSPPLQNGSGGARVP
jgi:hypothetical protein